MPKVKNETIMKQLNWRYATQKFDPKKKISAEDWHTLEESLRLTPSSYGLQPWHFLVVQSPQIRKKLTPASWNQPQIETCSHLLIVTHLKMMTKEYVEIYIQTISKIRGVAEKDLKRFRDVLVNDVVEGTGVSDQSHWAALQAYLAMGVFMTVAALLNIDVCPMEGIIPKQYDDILGLKDSRYTTLAVLAAGYRAADDQLQHAKKVRFERNHVIQVI